MISLNDGVTYSHDAIPNTILCANTLRPSVKTDFHVSGNSRQTVYASKDFHGKRPSI